MDVAHKQTDNLIDTTERKIKREYAKAQKEIESKANAYFASFADKDKKMLALVDEGKMSQDAYNAWRTQQLLVGKRWHDMSASLSQELANARGISASIVKGYMPEAYAENINFATYEIEAGTGVDTSFTLYDRQTVERIMRDNPQLLPDPSETIKDKIRQKQIDRWSKSKMTSALTQAILQGESIDKLAKRLRSVTSMDAAASLRNARTMMTNAQNAGRYDGYRRAKAMGVKFKVMWIATLDNRTRHEHRLLDGQMQEVDEPFTVGGIKIMYPADYGGKTYKVPPDMIYNCRCSIGAAVKGTRLYDEGIGAANREVGTGQTYEEWKNAKAKDKLNKPVEAPKPQREDNKKRFAFTPAETIKDAESYIGQYVDTQRFGALGVSYNGISLDVANEVNRTVGEFFETFNVEKFGGIIAPAGNTKYGKQIQGATAAYSEIRRSILLNRKTLKDINTATKHFKAEREAIEGILAHPERYDLRKASSQLRNIVENSKESGRSTIPQTIAEAINHELGHSLEKAVKKSDLWGKAVENMPKYGRKLSGYACQDTSEYIAESFCSYRKGENKADPVLVKIFDSLRRQ